ncbi:hypothetical protein AURDEDRAFT_160298 [Auricularia subglabra TFB-10046 SS5]|nr:hypothetical protein AURDEDRAFT_160298 [Auricularia subglabra TFB-10046 SS5]
MLREMHVKDQFYDPEVFVESKELLRSFAARPPFKLLLREDWRRWRFFRFFLEIQGFHQGQLDLTARTPERYSKLNSTWILFKGDFHNLMRKAAPTSRPLPTAKSRRKHWSDFRDRWGITDTISSIQIISCVARTREVMKKYREPVFQALHLVALPPEILGLVYAFSDMDDARSLSATCRYLRDIGLTDIFLTRRLFVDFHYTICDALGTVTGPALVAEILQHLFASVSSCLDGYHFLLTRRDICSRISYLEVGSRWPERVLNIVEDDSVPLFDDLHEHLVMLLPRLRLRRLEATGLDFDVSLAQRFAEQTSLTVCDLYGCSTTPALREHVRNLPLGSRPSSLQSLTVRIDDGGAIWPLLAFCPSLRLLSAYSFKGREIGLEFWPPNYQDLPQLSATLSSLERMDLDGLRGAIGLVDWFEAAAACAPMHLTHLKLAFESYMPDHFLIDLLRHAHAANAPLEVLVLDGILPASAQLVQTIAELFPDLIALTLIRRPGRRPDYRHEGKRSRWPAPLHAYAVHFRNFTRLRHFAANFYLDYEALSPVVLDDLINGTVPTRLREDEYDDNSAFERPEDLARPFAAYCSSLETFNIEGCRGRCWPYITITRSPAGAIVMKPTPRRWGGPPPEEIWNPDSSRPWTLPPHTENEQPHFARRPMSYMFR